MEESGWIDGREEGERVEKGRTPGKLGTSRLFYHLFLSEERENEGEREDEHERESETGNGEGESK